MTEREQTAQRVGQQMVDESVEIHAECQQRIAALEAELGALANLMQNYEPGGSPPPGGPIMHAKWILSHLQDRAEQAERELAEERARLNWFFGSTTKELWLSTYMRGVMENWQPNEWRAAIDAARGQK